MGDGRPSPSGDRVGHDGIQDLVHVHRGYFYFDVFTKEILTYKVAERRGAKEQYTDGLNDIVCLLKGTSEPVILHTDQGTVYASMAYNELIRDTNIIRSMSRAGKPTDNSVNEALNGWIKEELTIDFGIERCRGKLGNVSTFKNKNDVNL